MKRPVTCLLAAAIAAVPCASLAGGFRQQVRTFYDAGAGLPSADVRAVAWTAPGIVYAGTSNGLARCANSRCSRVEPFTARVDALAARDAELLVVHQGALWRLREARVEKMAPLPAGVAVRNLAVSDTVLAGTDQGLWELRGAGFRRVAALDPLLGAGNEIRQVAVSGDGRVAIAARAGLFLRDAAGAWRALHPRDGSRSWAPVDVRGVAFDDKGRLWFASPQGAGCLEGERWSLFTGEEGLPYDHFTTLTAGEPGVVWFGTRRGAIRFDGHTWEYRQGMRWLPDDEVRAIAVSPEGEAWIATAKGLSRIELRPMTFREKAAFFEQEIDKRHRRTPFGYVDSVRLKRPGDLSEWVQRDSDNDGLWTSMYGAGECFAWAATRDPAARRRARSAFEALRFLSTVTQGGTPAARPGFVARTILPTDGPDPNLVYTRERDEQMRATRDRLWKVLHPRWPRSADGKWYWKADTSSDELDGHFFFYALYYDLVAESPEEKAEVRAVVAAIVDHLLAHDFALVDWDGQPTRWAVFTPAKLNQDPDWYVERGLNSLSILSYLAVAEHMTAAGKYRAAAERLIREHHYAQNLMVPKIQAGPGTGNQSDDEMALMNFYNLVRYERDPELRSRYAFALYQYCLLELPELNPLFNFICAASLAGQKYRTPFQTLALDLPGPWLEESLDTLRRFPLDRVDWRLANSHRKDVIPLRADLPGSERAGRGSRRNGKVLPVDERFVEHWNHDPWRLDQGGQGLVLADGAAFLLPYYMGLYHGFVRE